MNIRLKKDEKQYVHSAHDIFTIMQAVLKRENRIDRNREHLWTICVDNGNKILNIELVSLGSIKATVVEPMEVFSIPLQKRAVSLILIHNHPSGKMIPSAADKDITDRLIQCGLILQVPVIDHLIISEENYYSFVDSGLLEQLGKSTRYVPDYIMQERLQKQIAKLSVESEKKGESKKALAMAAAMKVKGYSVKEIMELTGLSKKVIAGIK